MAAMPSAFMILVTAGRVMHDFRTDNITELGRISAINHIVVPCASDRRTLNLRRNGTRSGRLRPDGLTADRGGPIDAPTTPRFDLENSGKRERGCTYGVMPTGLKATSYLPTVH